MFFPFNGTLSSRLFWLAMSIVAVFVSSGYLWNRYREEFIARPEYQITQETVLTNAPPEFLQVDVTADVFDQLSDERLSLLDKGICQKIGNAFLSHRCVSGVYSVSKSRSGVYCQLNYHQPIAILETNSLERAKRLLPITESGDLLRVDDVDANQFSSLIRLSLPTIKNLPPSQSLLKETLQNQEVLQGITVAKQISSIETGVIKQVVAVRQTEHLEFQIVLNNGVTVNWGTALVQSAPIGQASAPEKLAALQEVVRQYATASEPDFLNLDIRTGKVRRMIPKTANARG